MKEDIAQKYLEGLLKFKAKRDEHQGFIPLERRNTLLKDLALELDFSEEIWDLSREAAQSHFLSHKLLNDDDHLEKQLPAAFKAKSKNELLQAIYLDPYNKEYLETYLLSHNNKWKPLAHYKKRYLSLFNPSTSEYTEVIVDLGLKIGEPEVEFLDDTVTGPFINALVFLQENPESFDESMTEKDVSKLREDSGLNKNDIKQLEQEIADMLNTIGDTINNSWLSWKQMHKGLLVVERLVNLAPNNPAALHAAIYFYGHSMWRLCLDSMKIKSGLNDQKAFYKTYLNKEKPSKKEKIEAANEAFDRAKELEQQFLKLPKELFIVNKNEIWKTALINPSWRMRGIMNGQQLDKNFIRTFIRNEEWSFQEQKKLHEFRQKNFIFGIVSGSIFMAIAAYLCYYFDQPYALLINFGIVPIFAAFGLAYLSEKIWKSLQKQSDTESVIC